MPYYLYSAGQDKYSVWTGPLGLCLAYRESAFLLLAKGEEEADQSLHAMARSTQTHVRCNVTRRDGTLAARPSHDWTAKTGRGGNAVRRKVIIGGDQRAVWQRAVWQMAENNVV